MASITTLPNGRGYRVQVRRKGVTLAQKNFPLGQKAEAKAWGGEQEALRRGGHVVRQAAARHMTVADLIERFRLEVVPSRRGSRWDDNRCLALQTYAWAKLDLTSWDAIHIGLMDWRDDRLRGSAREKAVTPQTVNRDLNLLGPIFDLAIKEWKVPLPVNPAHMVKRPKVVGGERKTVWSDLDIERFLTQVRWRDDIHPSLIFRTDDPQRQRRDNVFGYAGWLVLLLRHIGQRLGDVTEMQLGWIDLPGNVIHYPPGTVKNGEAFDCPLNRRAVELLTKYLAYRLDGRDVANVPDLRLFPSTTDTLGSMLRAERDELAKTYPAMSGLRLHDLRHTWTTELVGRVKNSVNPLMLLDMTGRKEMKSLKRYVNPDASDLANLMG